LKEDVVLKIDCEGCEYDVILSSSDEVFRHLSQKITMVTKI